MDMIYTQNEKEQVKRFDIVPALRYVYQQLFGEEFTTAVTLDAVQVCNDAITSYKRQLRGGTGHIAAEDKGDCQ